MSLESIRSSCAEIESIDAMLVQELDVDARVQEDLVLRDHRVSALLDRSSTVARATLRAYRDEDALLQSELAAMSNESTMFPSFYEKLRAQKLYHAQHRHVGGGAGAAVEARYVLPKDSALVSFSGEERWGRFVDLHAQYELFVNLDKVHASSTAAAAPGEAAAAAAAPRVDYHTYLETFARFDTIPAAAKDAAYVRYVGALRDYLVGFYARCNPIDGSAAAVATAGAKRDAALAAARSELGVAPHLAAAMSATALEQLGAAKLKEALAALGLKCGGTVADRAARLFATKGLAPADFPAEILASGGGGGGGKRRRRRRQKKGDGGGQAGAGAPPAKAAKTVSAQKPSPSATAAPASSASGPLGAVEQTLRSLERAEFVIAEFASLLSRQVEATKRNVEEKAIKTYEEMLREKEEAREVEQMKREEEELEERGGAGADGDDSDDDAPIYNPKNIPLGWDGKPIPCVTVNALLLLLLRCGMSHARTHSRSRFLFLFLFSLRLCTNKQVLALQAARPRSALCLRDLPRRIIRWSSRL